MRELKFRAWAGGVMVYFDLFNIASTNGYDDVKHFQRTESPHLSVSSMCPIMQYTGLKDKHNKEIYEGDSLRDTDSKAVGVVIWNDEETGFAVSFKESGGRTSKWGFVPFNGKDNSCEVIGNIYENPKLVKER